MSCTRCGISLVGQGASFLSVSCGAAVPAEHAEASPGCPAAASCPGSGGGSYAGAAAGPAQRGHQRSGDCRLWCWASTVALLGRLHPGAGVRLRRQGADCRVGGAPGAAAGWRWPPSCWAGWVSASLSLGILSVLVSRPSFGPKPRASRSARGAHFVSQAWLSRNGNSRRLPMAITPFRRVLAANRGEIAVRVFRASTELGFRTVAIFSEEDRVHLHRYKADEAYLVGKGLEPVAAYLAEDEIVELAKRARDRRHPPRLRPAVRARVVRAQVPRRRHRLHRPDARGDRGAGRQGRGAQDRGGGRRARSCRARPSRVRDVEEARAFADKVGYPVMVKAAGGGGGRGMRVVRDARRAAPRRSSARAPRRARPSATTRCSSRSWSCAPSTSRCRSWATTTATSCTCSSATARCSAATRRWSSTRPPGRCPQALRARLADDALQDRAPRRLHERRHGRVPGRRGRRPLLHRGEPPHPGRAHRHRGDHGPRPGAGADPHRRRATASSDPEIGIASQADDPAARRRDPGARHRRGSAQRLPARHGQDPGLPPGGRASASASTTARATSARASRRTTIRCWSRSPPAASSGTTSRRKTVRALREFRIRGVKTNLAVPRKRPAAPDVRPRARRTRR